MLECDENQAARFEALVDSLRRLESLLYLAAREVEIIRKDIERNRMSASGDTA